MMVCTPENEEGFYMFLYIEGTKMRKKNSKFAPNFKMRWEPWPEYDFKVKKKKAHTHKEMDTSKIQPKTILSKSVM